MKRSDAEDSFWTMIGMIVLTEVINSPSAARAFDGFALHFMQIISDRCPKCGYKWTQPKAFLSGEEC